MELAVGMLVSYGTGSWKASKVMAVGMPVFMADGICNGIQKLKFGSSEVTSCDTRNY